MVFTKQDHVNLLTKNHFNSNNTLKKNRNDIYDIENGITIVLFYAEWCGYCVKLKPLYIAAARITCCNSNICAVDCSSNSETQQLVNKSSRDNKKERIIDGYPTILRYKDGKYIDSFSLEKNLVNLKKFMLGAGL